MTVLERLLQFAQFKGLSVHAFEKKLGKSHSYLSQVKNVSADVLQKACEEYPELSAEWLISGKGSMILGEAIGQASDESEEVRKLKHKIDILLQKVIIAEDKILELEVENRMLKERLG